MADPALGKVSIGRSLEDVVRVLGEPESIRQTDDFIDQIYSYRLTSVGFTDGIVAAIQTRDPGLCTPEALCVGDSFKRMQALYGKPVVRTPRSGRFEYYPGDGSCWYELSISRGKIASIKVICLP